MADNILRLTVEDSEYNAKLKKAAEGIRHLAEVAHRGGGELTGLEKAELDYVKALGTMETKSRTASGSVRELESTFKELTVVYNHLNDVEKQDEGGKALRASLEQIKQRAQEARTELDAASKSLQGAESSIKGVSDGSFLSKLGGKMDGALAVFGGNLMTKAAGMAAQFGTELVGMVQQGMELAKQGEGIRIAFERLGRGDILDGLRQATHGTVTDIELMKAAVKFNDFKLPLDQLGTMLAFAQQKAKDTGQSVDYMVDSIVTGLGRKSLMILDNLGLSAAQIKERMAETGDMTKAVGDIIREEMSKSGDYIETAAERATQADVQLQNAMENLGRTLLPLQEQGEGMWKSLETGAINLLNEGLTPMVPKVIELKNEIGELYDTISGSSVFSGLVDWMETGIDTASVFIPKLRLIRELLDFGNGNAAGAGAGIGGIIANIPDQTINEIPEVEVIGHKSTRTKTGGSRGRNKQSTADMLLSTFNKANGKIDAASLMDTTTTGGSELFRMMQAAHNATLPTAATQGEKDAFENRRREVKAELKKNDEEKNKKDKDAVEVADQIYGGVSSMVSSLEQMGIELPEGLTQVVGAIGGVIGVLQSIMMIVNAIQAMQEVGSFLGLFKNGGIVPHAQNGLNVVGGTHYSGDVTPILANAGEVVLNRSQVSTLASQLQGGGAQNMKLEATVSGEQLRFVLNNNGRRTGRGEYVQSTKRS